MFSHRLWPSAAHQRCAVHKLRNLVAKAPKHAHEAMREDYHRIVYAETRDAAQQAHAAFLLNWKKLCPTVAASLGEAGEQLLTFYQFPASQHLSLRTTNIIERMQQEFRRRLNPGGTAQRRDTTSLEKRKMRESEVQIGNSG